MIHAEGPLLSIDVTSEETKTVDVSEVLERFIGGRGVATRLAHERVSFDVDPFGPENRLYFTTGPLQMSRMSFTGRLNATSVSPLTSGLASSNAGGFISRNFAATGYSGIELLGASDDLIIVHVTDEDVTFEAVPELERATVPEVTDHVERNQQLGADNVACIGPAGENQVRFASIMTTESRAFGRCGLGAVLGAKNVKAITFSGDSNPEIDIPDVATEIHREAATSDHPMRRQGTTAIFDLSNSTGGLPTRYFQEQSFEHGDRINGDTVESKKYKKGTCSACAYACKLPTRDEEAGIETEGPEFETLMAFGSNCAVDDIVSIMKSNELCDTLGMDTISCGNAIAAYLKANGEFGNSNLIHELIASIAYREGIGDLLAEGIHRFHDELGVKDWTVKGLSFSAQDGRALNGQGLSFATATRGADHMFSTFYMYEYPTVDREEALDPEGLEGKPAGIVEEERNRAIEDSGIICRFSTKTRALNEGFRHGDYRRRLFRATEEELDTVGERIVTLERHFNNQRGIDREDDTLPYEIPGFSDGLDKYYNAHGWTADGIVPEKRVERIYSSS